MNLKRAKQEQIELTRQDQGLFGLNERLIEQEVACPLL